MKDYAALLDEEATKAAPDAGTDAAAALTGQACRRVTPAWS